MTHDLLPVSLLIADDHKLFTEGLFQILKEEKTIGSIYTAANGREAVDKALMTGIDCVIMDINMPVLNGLEATLLIKKEKPEIKVIVVSMLCDASIVKKLLKAGAEAFINKDSGKSELLKAIDKVMRNEKYISPQILEIISAHPDKDNGPEMEKPLTTREKEVIRYIAEGLTNQQIAARLFLSTVTVDTHRKNILAKLHLRNTASLVKYAAEKNLL